jgi:hypothetical protein
MKHSQLKQLIKEEIRSVIKEYTNKNFSGDKVIAYAERNKPDNEDMEIIKRYFPNAVKSMATAEQNLKASDASPIKQRMGQYAPMFVHVQRHRFEGDATQDPHPDKDGIGKEFGVHQFQYYNSNFRDKPGGERYNPRVTELSFSSLQPHYKMGTILAITDEYIKDLQQLKITRKS